MNYGIDHIIEKVMTDKNASGEIAVMVLDILRIAARIEDMYKKPVVIETPKPEIVDAMPEYQPKVKVRHKYRKYTINGKTKTVDEWCEEYGLSKRTLEGRIYRQGLSFEEALTKTKSSNKIAVIQYDRYGKQIRQFDSVSKMARELQIPIGRAHRALRMTPSEQVSDYGFYFMTA